MTSVYSSPWFNPANYTIEKAIGVGIIIVVFVAFLVASYWWEVFKEKRKGKREGKSKNQSINE